MTSSTSTNTQSSKPPTVINSSDNIQDKAKANHQQTRELNPTVVIGVSCAGVLAIVGAAVGVSLACRKRTTEDVSVDQNPVYDIYYFDGTDERVDGGEAEIVHENPYYG